jgi:hypothetical protein
LLGFAEDGDKQVTKERTMRDAEDFEVVVDSSGSLSLAK